MKVVATFHSPSSVSHSIKCTLTPDPDLDFLVVAKTNRLEVFALFPEGLKLQCTQDIWGRVASLQAVQRDNSSKSQLLMTTDHPDPKLFLLDYVQLTTSAPHLSFSKVESLFERGSRPTEFFTGALVDPLGDVAVVSSYVGKLKVIELNSVKAISDFDVSVRELNVLSMCFLKCSPYEPKVLAILHQDHSLKLILTSHEISIAELELSSNPSPLLPEISVRDPNACILIPVPPHRGSTWNAHGGVLVLGGSQILFYRCAKVDRKQKRKKGSNILLEDTAEKKKSKPVVQADWPFSDITAWAQVDETGTRYLIGDSFGRLALLALGLETEELLILSLGNASPPTSLTPLSSQYIFLGSHFGDSQLLRIVPDKSSFDGTYIDVLDCFKNIAPIMDAVLADTDESGQHQIITCSGGKSSGSLRIIRSGATFDEIFAVENVPNVTNIWPLKNYFQDEYDSHLLVATPASTALYSLSSTASNDPTSLINVSEVPNSGVISTSRTLASANIVKRTISPSGKSVYEDSPYVVQVTTNDVVLLNMSVGIAEAHWVPEGKQEIVAADITPSQICVGLYGGRIVLLNVDHDRINELSHKDFKNSRGLAVEISTISIAPFDPSRFFSNYVAVGFWESNEVIVYSLPKFERKGEPHKLTCLPRSLLLYDFGERTVGGQPHLLVGQGNGTLVVFSFDKGLLGNKKVIQLGDVPVLMTPYCVHGRPTVFASGNRSVILFWNRESLQHSPVLLRDVLATSWLNVPFSRSSLVLASPLGLSIGCVQELEKLHIRSVSMGLDNPVRIAYLPESKLFGVGCVRTEPYRQDDVEKVSSSLKIIDDTSFDTLNTYPLERDEELTALNAVILEDGDHESPYLCVGSMYHEAIENEEPSRGRILVFTARNQQATNLGGQQLLPFLHASVSTKGCVYAVASIRGKLAAAIDTGVVLYGMESPSPATNTAKLVKLTEWNHNYFVTSIVSRHDLLVTGDAISSIAVLRLVDLKLQTIARDYGPLWPLCVEIFDKTIVGANSDSNLFSFKLQAQGDKEVLDHDGGYHIDDNVNKFVSGCLASTDADHTLLSPKQLFFTSSGRIGVIIDVDDTLSLHLSALQRNLAGTLPGPGNIDHNTWRAPHNARGRSDAQNPSYGFLDGDFLEQFLDLSSSSPQVAKILAGKSEPEQLKMTYDQIRSMLESLKALH